VAVSHVGTSAGGNCCSITYACLALIITYAIRRYTRLLLRCCIRTYIFVVQAGVSPAPLVVTAGDVSPAAAAVFAICVAVAHGGCPAKDIGLELDWSHQLMSAVWCSVAAPLKGVGAAGVWGCGMA
jgi:hypothetical protein